MFTGYNEESQQIDLEKLVGIFNYYMTKFYTIDYDLYNYICDHGAETNTTIIHQNIWSAIYN